MDVPVRRGRHLRIPKFATGFYILATGWGKIQAPFTTRDESGVEIAVSDSEAFVTGSVLN